MSYRMKSERTENARDSAYEIISWLNELRGLPDIDHEMRRCVGQALKHARRLARYMDDTWINEPVLPDLPKRTPPPVGNEGSDKET